MEKRVVGCFIFFTLLLFFVAESILNLTPPITRDALIHHLAIPKLWIKNGGFYETPWADFSYYPMYVNLLYIIPLYFKNDSIPKFIHMAFGLGTGLLIFKYLKEKYNHVWGLLGLLFFLSTPIVVWLSTSAYIDLGATFFSTASVFAYARWRDSGYHNIKHLIVSSCYMGFAIGSKYNLLVGWFILNLMIIMFYARDTKKQIAALKFGAIFFIISLTLASPWYIKNYTLTNNPVYPLFNGFFTALHHNQLMSQVIQEQIKGSAEESVGFFRLREYLYGETFWETLAIPLRMFFQGEDNSYQYFQGRLNPVLIVFFPFIFLNRKFGKDKVILVCFCFFFIWVAYFTTAKQVRYLLPIVPLFTILAVMGIKNIIGYLRRKPVLINRLAINGLYIAVLVLLSLNVFYLKDHFFKINPLPYILKKESRDAFLTRHLMDYAAVQFINSHLPENAVVYTIYLGRRGYYLERNYKNDPSFGVTLLGRLIDSMDNGEKFKNIIESSGASHIMMRTDLVNRFLRINYDDEKIKHFVNFINSRWIQLYNKGNLTVWEIH